MSDPPGKSRRIEPWQVVLVLGSCVAVLIAGYAVHRGTPSRWVCTDGSKPFPSVGTYFCDSGSFSPPPATYISVSTRPWWLAAGLTEALVIVVAFAVGAKPQRKA